MRISSGSSKAARLDVFFFHRNYSNGTPFFAYNGIFPLVCSSAQTFLQTPEKKEKFWHFMKEQKEQITHKKKECRIWTHSIGFLSLLSLIRYAKRETDQKHLSLNTREKL